jgi:uncharacterized protein YdaU (DUF1376 family)
MKFYPRDPDAFFAGVSGMTFEQIGIYTLIIDLLYSRDGLVPDDDAAMIATLHADPRVWRRVKAELIALGKIRTTTDGMLDANGVANRRLLAEVRSTSARHAVNVRWTNYRKAKEINTAAIQGRNTSKSKSIYSSTNVEAQCADNAAKGWPEAASDNRNTVPKPKPETATPPRPSTGTAELKATLRAKGWIP